MKQAYFHVFYLTVIAFLGYNYWSSVQAFKAFEHLNKQLTIDYDVLDNAAWTIHREITKLTNAYPNALMIKCADMVEKAESRADTLIQFIDSNKAEFVGLNGGLISPNNNDSINNTYSTKVSKSFFTDAKIKEIKGKLTEFSTVLMDSISNEGDRIELLKRFNLPKLITDAAYWQLLKTLPANAVLAEFTSIKNTIKMDEIILLNYYYGRFSVCDIRFDTYKTVIAPRKAFLIEGETFETDVFLTAYSSDFRSNVIFRANDKILGTNRGIAHFKGEKETVGTKTFKAVATIKNPLTGQVSTAESSFQYEVLPKCRRDCQ